MAAMEENKAAFLKQATAWGGVGVSKWFAAIGITSWSDMSAALACVVSFLFILDWVWKKWKSRRRRR